MRALAAVLLLLSASSAVAQTHPCAKDAIAKAGPLLKLHFGEDIKMEQSIGDKVKVLPPVKALKGNGKLDVLEVWGYIYKAEYRMRFLYVQSKDKNSCALMGQEIIENANPY